MIHTNNMSGNSIIKPTTALLAVWFFVALQSHAQTISRLSTRFLARGEQALLEVSVAGIQPVAFPEIPAVAGVTIRPAGRSAQTRLMPGRKLEYVFEYLVSSYEIGNHTLPAIEVSTAGAQALTQPLEFTVFNPDELRWSEAVAGNTRFRYASAFRALNPRPFEGETTPVEIKIFVPRDLFVEDWGIPDFQRDGVTSWRFQPSGMRGQVNLLGMPYVSVAYPSTLTPTRTGAIGIGPATIRLITTQVVMEGILRRVSQEAHLEVPKLALESIPLPEGAPEGFENAVGNFKLQVATALTEVQEGDPIPVEITVTGSGNLDTLRPPKPIETSGWKIYDAATDPRGDERRELSGATVFRQFLRPLELKSAIPPFRLVVFDPKSKTYNTLLTEAIPLQMTPASAPKGGDIAPPQALSTPVERMTDILAPLETAQLTLAPATRFPGWLGHGIAALLAFALVLRALWLRYGHLLHKDPVRSARISALHEIERMKTSDESAFLMAAGRFIERWLGDSPSPELQAVLAERDARCFRPEKNAPSPLEPKHRETILKTLRKAVMIWSAAALLAIGSSQQLQAAAPTDPSLATRALAAYDSAKFDEAISLWLQAGRYEELSPDTLYNIGNACYRAGSPGHAALYFRRALSRDPGHQESRQNLRFIERKYGSITVHRPEFQYAIARFPLASWQNLLWTGTWISLLAMLVFPATHRGARVRVPAIAALVVGPMLAFGGGLGWRYYPSDSEFTPLARQAVIIGEKVVLHADAARTSPEVIDAPPGSLCEIIRQSGRWAYISFATKTRGWVPMESIEKVLPDAPPAPPRIRKPKADGKSA